jgi:hypothetical protein
MAHRLIKDARGNDVRFGYDLESERSDEGFTVRVKPLTGNTAPTFATSREITGVKEGDSVTVDLLSNPATGEKIRDILQLAYDPHPAAPKTGPSEFVFERPAIAIRTRSGEQHWMNKARVSGAAVRMYVPGRGAYYLSLARPAAGGFEPAGIADADRLSFTQDGDLIEIDSRPNVLKDGGFARVWVRHDPSFKPQDDPTRLFLTATDAIDYLLPKK